MAMCKSHIEHTKCSNKHNGRYILILFLLTMYLGTTFIGFTNLRGGLLMTKFLTYPNIKTIGCKTCILTRDSHIHAHIVCLSPLRQISFYISTHP